METSKEKPQRYIKNQSIRQHLKMVRQTNRKYDLVKQKQGESRWGAWGNGAKMINNKWWVEEYDVPGTCRTASEKDRRREGTRTQGSSRVDKAGTP